MKTGESKQVKVPPEEGYGTVDKEAFLEVAKDKIPPDAQTVGAQIQGQNASGQPVRARVAEVKDNTVVVDFNHPLAGKTLYFDIKVLNIQQTPGQ
jgi:FKBP-type peptidyl-prolyl cis-trans isomerase SlyD